MFEGLSNITKNKERKLIVFPFGFYVIFTFFVLDFLMYFNIIICGVPPPCVLQSQNTIQVRATTFHAIKLYIIKTECVILACAQEERSNPKLCWSN